MIPLSQLQRAVQEGIAFLRPREEISISVILSGQAALSLHSSSSRRNLGWYRAVGQGVRSQIAQPATSVAQ